MIIPLSDTAKDRADVGAVGTAMLAFFKAIPWPEIAAFAAFVYTLLRIIETIQSWLKKRK